MVLKCRCGGTVVESDGEAACSRCGIVYDAAPERRAAWSEAVRRVRYAGRWRLYGLDRTVSRPSSKAYLLIGSICGKCGVPDAVRRRAISLHASVVAHGLHQGWNLEARVAAVVTLACRMDGVPRTTKAICEAAGVKPGQAHHIYCAVVRDLGIVVPPPDPAAYTGSIAAACNIPEPARRRADSMLRKACSGLTGKDPTTLAAAALYVACSESGCGVSQQAIADAAHVSTVSMRLRRQDLERAAAGAPTGRSAQT